MLSLRAETKRLILFAGGRIPAPPYNVHTLLPGSCGHVMLHGNNHFYSYGFLWASGTSDRVCVRNCEEKQLAAQKPAPSHEDPILLQTDTPKDFCFFQITIHSPNRDHGQLPRLLGVF